MKEIYSHYNFLIQVYLKCNVKASLLIPPPQNNHSFKKITTVNILMYKIDTARMAFPFTAIPQWPHSGL